MLSKLQALNTTGVILLFVCLAGTWVADLEAGEPKGGLVGFAMQRPWTSGAYKIDAKLAYADDETVKLAKSDGKTVTVPLSKLSEPDQAFVKSFLQAEKALSSIGSGGEDPNNPFAGGVPSNDVGTMQPSNGGVAIPSGQIPKKEAIVKGIRPISVSPGREFWEVEGVRGFPAVEFQEIVIPTPVAKPFFAAMRMQAAGRAGNAVMNSYQEDRGRRGSFGKFAVVNAVTGDVSPPLELDQPWKLMDVSADGRRVAAVRIEGFDKGNDVAILKIDENRVVPEYQFTAGGGSWDELHFIAFLPQNRLMTISQKHNLTIWDLANPIGPKALYRGSSGGKLWAELSPAGELLAMIAGKSLAFVDTSEFKLRGYIARDEEPKHMAFSPDGKLLAAYHPFQVALYSMETGEETTAFAVSESNPNTKLRWAGDHLLVGNVLYDTEKGAPLWTYASRGAAQCTLGSYLFTAFGGDKQSTLTVYQVPHNEALRVSNEIDANDLYCIQPGDAVAVDYDLGYASIEVQGKIQDAVEAKIAELGWRITGGAANRITIKLEQGEREEAEYYTRSGFGPMFFSPFARPSGPSEKVSYQPWKHTLTIVSSGKQVHNAVMNRTAPQNLSTKEGQSTQQAVTNYCQPYPAYFKGLTIPPHILKPKYQGGLGTSTITDSGMR